MTNDQDNDPVWKLLEHASEQKAGPMFSRDVMRSVRLEPQKTWWQKLLQPAPVMGGLTAAAACVALILLSPEPESPQAPAQVADSVEQLTTEQGFDAIAQSLSPEDDLHDLIDPLSMMSTNDIDLLNDFELLMEL